MNGLVREPKTTKKGIRVLVGILEIRLWVQGLGFRQRSRVQGCGTVPSTLPCALHLEQAHAFANNKGRVPSTNPDDQGVSRVEN